MSSISTVSNYGGRIQPQGNIKQFVVGIDGFVQWIFKNKTKNVITPDGINMSVYINKDLYVNGAIFNTSDINLKDNITPINEDKILNLNPVSFNFKFDKNKLHYGFIAQEVEKIYPELVKTTLFGYKTVNYIELIPLLLLNMKTFKNEIDDLKQIVNDLKQKLNEYKDEVIVVNKNDL